MQLKLKSWRVLSGSVLKYIAAFLMLADHIGQMFALPVWTRVPGRIVAPIFVFFCAEGFAHTRNRKTYLLRLLAGFLAMNAANALLGYFLPVQRVNLTNNIFGTLFLIALYLLFIELIRTGKRERAPAKLAGGIALLLAPLLVSALVESLAVNFEPPVTTVLSFLPTLFSVEGKWPFVLLGVSFYLLRGKRWMQCLALALVSLLFLENVQWMMAFAAVPLLLYNGERGRVAGPRFDKYFFYAFYPAHVYALYVLAWVLQR